MDKAKLVSGHIEASRWLGIIRRLANVPIDDLRAGAVEAITGYNSEAVLDARTAPRSEGSIIARHVPNIENALEALRSDLIEELRSRLVDRGYAAQSIDAWISHCRARRSDTDFTDTEPSL